MLRKNSYCSYCGSKFQDGQSYPRTCASCEQTTYENPIPVSVVLLPVGKELLVIRRNIEPQKGRLALPGGFIELNESWQRAARRELFEEASIEIAAEDLRLFDVKSAPDGTVLIFALASNMEKSRIKPYTESEIQEIAFIDRPQGLGFALHTEIVRKFFQEQNNLD